MTDAPKMLVPTAGLMERRRHQRTPLKMRLNGIRLDPDGGDVVDTLHMLDISKGGIGAMCVRAFYPGQRIVLSLPLSEERGRRNIYATIVRCRENDGGYNVGVEFDSASLNNRSAPARTVAAA